MNHPGQSIFDADHQPEPGTNSRITLFLAGNVILLLLLILQLDITPTELARMRFPDLFVLSVILLLPILSAILVYKRKKAGWIIGLLFYEFTTFVCSAVVIKQLVDTGKLTVERKPAILTGTLILAGVSLMVLLL